MNQYITGAAIRELREKRGLTQSELAEKLSVSDKTISKWETAKGYPDITLLEPIAAVLGVSVPELLSGNFVSNTNTSGNMLRAKLYVCPVCGNVICSAGQSLVSCHGITLPALEAEESPAIRVESVEDEYYVTVDHPMTREHHISFIAALSCDTLQLVKLYPEGEAAAGIKKRWVEKIYCYCNRDGLFVKKLR